MEQAVQIALQRPGLRTVATDQENAEALEHLRGAFGLMSIGQLRAEARQLKPLVLDGISADPEELAAGRYPLSRTLFIAWRDRLGQEVSQFLAFLGSEPAAALLARLGHIPMFGPTA
jgi:phosphate transport system substrate-binding protein